MGSPVKSRENLLLLDFSGKRHAKTPHVMGFPVIPTEKSGQRGGGGYIGTNNTVSHLVKIFKMRHEFIYNGMLIGQIKITEFSASVLYF